MRSHAVTLDPTTRAERLLRLAAEVPGGVAALLAELRADLMAANAMVDNPDDHAVDGAVTNFSSKDFFLVGFPWFCSWIASCFFLMSGYRVKSNFSSNIPPLLQKKGGTNESVFLQSKKETPYQIPASSFV